jgi:hypothetical protein
LRKCWLLGISEEPKQKHPEASEQSLTQQGIVFCAELMVCRHHYQKGRKLNHRLIAASILLFFSLTSLLAQTKLKKGDRPVFWPARHLAELCEDWNALNPGGHPPKDDDVLHIRPSQIASAFACEAYILGASDQQMESVFGKHYHPVPTRMGELKQLVDAFLEYVQDHPEEQDFAATTILDKVTHILDQQTPDKTKR